MCGSFVCSKYCRNSSKIILEEGAPIANPFECLVDIRDGIRIKNYLRIHLPVIYYHPKLSPTFGH